MTYILVSTWKSVCSDCKANILEPTTVTECPDCGISFDGVIMLVATAEPFHKTLPHVAPYDAPHVNTMAMTWCRPWKDRLPYEVVPEL